jgi:hypothetical protein
MRSARRNKGGTVFPAAQPRQNQRQQLMRIRQLVSRAKAEVGTGASRKMMRNLQFIGQAEAAIATIAGTSDDVLGCWGTRNDTRLLEGGPLDLEETRTMIESTALSIWDRKNSKLLSQSDALAMKIPRCPRYDIDALVQTAASHALLGGDAAAVNAYLDHQLAGLDRKEPLIVAVMEFFQLPETISAHADKGPETVSRAELCLNFLCGMRRLGLDKRLLVWAMDKQSNESLASFGGLRVLHHDGLRSAASRASNFTEVHYDNRIAKLILPLLLLERGFPVLLTDIDSYWVKDPMPYLLNLGVDFAAQSDNCPNTLNSGFVFYSGSRKSRQVLELALSQPKFRNAAHELASDNDQYLLNCAHGYAFVHEGLRSTVLPRTTFTFGTQVEGFMNFGCDGRTVKVRAEEKYLPYVWHTSGASGGDALIGLTQMLKTVGFWDVKPTSAKGAAQGYCLDGRRDSPKETQTQAKQAGLDSCRKAWHPRCQCAKAAFKPS